MTVEQKMYQTLEKFIKDNYSSVSAFARDNGEFQQAIDRRLKKCNVIVVKIDGEYYQADIKKQIKNPEKK